MIYLATLGNIFPPIFTRFGVHLSLLTRPISEPSDWASSDLEYIHRVRRSSCFIKIKNSKKTRWKQTNRWKQITISKWKVWLGLQWPRIYPSCEKKFVFFKYIHIYPNIASSDLEYIHRVRRNSAFLKWKGYTLQLHRFCLFCCKKNTVVVR